jgi:hypothetical protein
VFGIEHHVRMIRPLTPSIPQVANQPRPLVLLNPCVDAAALPPDGRLRCFDEAPELSFWQ